MNGFLVRNALKQSCFVANRQTNQVWLRPSVAYAHAYATSKKLDKLRAKKDKKKQEVDLDDDDQPYNFDQLRICVFSRRWRCTKATFFVFSICRFALEQRPTVVELSRSDEDLRKAKEVMDRYSRQMQKYEWQMTKRDRLIVSFPSNRLY